MARQNGLRPNFPSGTAVGLSTSRILAKVAAATADEVMFSVALSCLFVCNRVRLSERLRESCYSDRHDTIRTDWQSFGGDIVKF